MFWERTKQAISRSHLEPKISGPFRLLLLLSVVYDAIVSVRLALYRVGLIRPVRVSATVISIGNITTGGTGKTPIIAALAKRFLDSGKRVVILSRGYGARKPQAYARATNPDFGDEACWIQRLLPEAVVIVGRNRAENAKRTMQEYNPDVILLDDGFQYIRLARDVNIVLVDGRHGFGNGSTLPAGPLREPLTQIKRADAVWITKEFLPKALVRIRQSVRQCAPGLEDHILTVAFEPVGLWHPATNQMLTSIPSWSWLAVSGIAQPANFEEACRLLGLSLEHHQAYGDHHAYTPDDTAALVRKIPKNGALVTTDKDWIKLAELIPDDVKAHCYVLRIAPMLPEHLDCIDAVLKDSAKPVVEAAR